MEEGNTFLEDFIQSVELLPNDVRRDFELMRVLDRECTESQAELIKSEVCVFVCASLIYVGLLMTNYLYVLWSCRGTFWNI